MNKIYANLGMLVLLTVVIGLGLSMLSPCFQKRFLDGKNLYTYMMEK